MYDHLVLSALAELSDEEYQRRVWNSVDGPEVSSFTESVERLWDDSGLSADLESEHGAYGHLIDQRLRELDLRLSKIDSDRYPDEIIADPAMSAIRQLAREIRDQIVAR
jgi:hypothetical protein